MSNKWSSFGKQQAIMENWRKYTEGELLTERADVKDFDSDRFPMKLSDVDPAQAKAIAQAGKDNVDGGKGDDVIPVDQNGSWAAAELKPSQTSMHLGKASWFALGMLNGTMFESGGPGGKTGAFVSSDKYLMDGHHRWIATSMAEPSAPIGGYEVAFPGQQLVAILNTITKGLLGVAQGKSGKGGFEQFHNRDAIVTVLTNLAQDKQMSDKNKPYTGVAGAPSPGKALEVMQEKTGKQGKDAISAMADHFLKNLSSVPGASASAVMPGAPERSDMPVIEPDDHQTAISALNQGEIDVDDPYGYPPKGKTAEE